MKRKGASLIFEQVMLFVIGIIIFLICFTVFKAYEIHYTNTIAYDQLHETSLFITSTILTLARDSDAEVPVSVPGTIGFEPYTIELTQEGLKLTSALSKRSVFRGLSSINETYQLSGRHSTSGKRDQFMIYKSGNKIIIG